MNSPWANVAAWCAFWTATHWLLDTGQSVRLVGVAAPAAPYRDRYDRALAHVVTTDALGPRLWLNAEMVKKGGARVRVYPDTATANAPLLALEAAARADGRGLWDDGVWPIHNAAALPPEAERFQIVEGVAGAMQGSEERFAVCDVALRGSPLILEIGKSAAELCQLPEGAKIRARGFLRDGRLEISHPLNLEMLN